MTTLGNPAPLGLLAFGITTAMLMSVDAGWVEKEFEILIYGYGVFLGGLCQMLVAIFELFKGSSFSFAVFGCYGAFWLGWAIVFAERARSTSSFGDFEYAKGQTAFYAIWGVLTSCFFVITLRKNMCLIIVFALLAVTFFLLAAATGTGNAYVKIAAGYFGFATAFGAFYTGIAELINEEWGRHVLPGLRPLYNPERFVITTENIRTRISYHTGSNTMLLEFRGMQIRNMASVQAIKKGVDAAIIEFEPPENKVHAIVDYKDVLIADAVATEYWSMVADIQRKYYLSVRRFHATSFGTNFGNEDVAAGMKKVDTLDLKVQTCHS
eukprot:CAMPEP_0172510046 /NCGR_PEP_ID=MMETSP1066-20121228/225681_1 /TAXON_ID=671091 /ORGANISM="Coscinodiscus wailesii, Strain CCMP2513" /LENGTH=323 /DNA_ID=CAMNT_0013288841 /DNA_START=15 /DNA_END=986 /DNA_ORIENTATION=+